MTPRVAIVCFYPFPEGMAATTRIIAYSKGMIANGAEVDVFLMNPSDRVKATSYPDEGLYEGIRFCYPIGRIRSGSRLAHSWEVVRAIWATVRRILVGLSVARYQAVIVSCDIALVLFLFGSLSWLIGTKSIFIFDEYPIPIRRYLRNAIPLHRRAAYWCALGRVSGYIGMTSNLVNFYQAIRAKPSLVVSTVVDMDRFGVAARERPERRFICYMGNMELAKDNVDNIIRAFSLVAEKYSDLDLHLYGRPNSADRQVLVDLLAGLGLGQRVIFDAVSYRAVPEILATATVLVSSQPKTVRAQGGFPTKLGEYLATGVPVLVTRVGEIGEQLTDGTHVFFAEPEDPIGYAMKLQYILENYEVAQSVASAGRQLVMEKYSNRVQGKRMLDFIEELCNS